MGVAARSGARGFPCRSAALIASLLALFAVATPAADAAISVSPTSIKIADGSQTAVVRITNAGSSAEQLQIRVMSWTHDQTGDHLSPTTDLVASPPFVSIAPGASQAIRVGLRTGGAGATPTYFRILVSEIVAPSQPGTINFALTVSVPAIIGGQYVREPQLHWTAKSSAAGIDLVALDQSPWHATIAGLRVSDSSGRSIEPEVVGTSGVVLPGRERRWTVAGLGAAAGRHLILTGTMNGAAFTTSVDVDAR